MPYISQPMALACIACSREERRREQKHDMCVHQPHKGSAQQPDMLRHNVSCRPVLARTGSEMMATPTKPKKQRQQDCLNVYRHNSKQGPCRSLMKPSHASQRHTVVPTNAQALAM